jgi:hypothetical protein
LSIEIVPTTTKTSFFSWAIAKKGEVLIDSISARNAERALLFIERKAKVKFKDIKIIKIK